jgi:hypothetical protein
MGLGIKGLVMQEPKGAEGFFFIAAAGTLKIRRQLTKGRSRYNPMLHISQFFVIYEATKLTGIFHSSFLLSSHPMKKGTKKRLPLIHG